MRAKLVGGPFDGQEVETSEDTLEIASDGGKYFKTGTEKLIGPDGLPVVGGTIPVFEFESEE